MGNWAIIIRGTGVHHNKDLPKDANRLAAGFVELLKQNGHQIDEASFVSGGAELLTGTIALYDSPTPLAIQQHASPEQEAQLG